MCDCYKYARDYRKICELAQLLANEEKVEYWVYQKEDKSYGCDRTENIPEGAAKQLRLLPNN
jgi:hypothetical protein